MQIEEYIPGSEYALEGLLENGTLRTLAIFDKPDPLDGPFFEETIYVTPSRPTPATQRQIEEAVAAAAAALGLHHGPIHAECRVNGRGVFVLEVAARPIGGLCAKALRIRARPAIVDRLRGIPAAARAGRADRLVDARAQASAVMMIPIPRSGVYRRVDGVDEASAGAARRGGRRSRRSRINSCWRCRKARATWDSSSRGPPTPAAAERAVREAHARLRFTIDPLAADRNDHARVR